MRFSAGIVLTTAMALYSASAATFAHHSFAGQFDNTISVTLHGVVTSVEMVYPHSFIYVDVNTHGAVERWALEGPGAGQARRMGWARDFIIKAGDELGACGYLARSDVTPTRSEPGTAKRARKLQAAVLTMASRGTFLWSNYGQGKCGLDTR
jgi:hypothetical protein